MKLALPTSLVFVVIAVATADEKTKREVPAVLGPKIATVGMKIKLDFAKNILEGLSTEDHAKVLEGAKAMRGMNEIESFVRGRSPAYLTQLNIFRTATDALAESAAEKNLDGESLAYTQMTISCVNCHKVLRANQR